MTLVGSVHFMSKTNEWATPQDFFDRLDEEFDFTLDPCATPENAKCNRYFTKGGDGLSQDWSGDRVFMNPPYGREIGKWVRKAYEESQKGALVVCLIPARTDTSYWHEFVIGGGAEVRFVRGRIKFENGEKPQPAPFPSAIVIFKPKKDSK